MYGIMPYIKSMAAAQNKPARTTQAEASRSARLEARITVDQKAQIERAAAYAGRSVTDFVVGAISAAAEAVIQEQELIRLSRAESKAFVAALLKPTAPNAELKKAARRYRKSVASR